jgi:hypothetical protein
MHLPRQAPLHLPTNQRFGRRSSCCFYSIFYTRSNCAVCDLLRYFSPSPVYDVIARFTKAVPAHMET